MPKQSKTKPYTEADMRAVSDNPKWTKNDFAKAKRFDEVFPEMAATIRGRGKQKAPTKVQVTLRLSETVIDHFKSGGPGWQSRIDEELKKVASRKQKAP